MSEKFVEIPSELLPEDGRFGSGPSKVRREAVQALADAAGDYLGTSHRQPPVRSMVARLKEGLMELFTPPDGYEVVLGNGGTTVFWDALLFGVIERRSAHAVFGEFSAKFAHAAGRCPHLEAPLVARSEPGSHPESVASEQADIVALTHNETSTGVTMPVSRAIPDGLVAVDATSAAGALRIDLSECDLYYFAPQKCLASDGGLWLSLCSPAAIERIEKMGDGRRYIPSSIDLVTALNNARADQTYNTPALATLFLAVTQVEWLLDNGGLEWGAARSEESARILYGWAEESSIASPFVGDADKRSPVVGTIDFSDAVDAPSVARCLRSNGIVDTEPYRKLGRNQLRVGMYPAVEPDDVRQLTRCIDFVIDALDG